MPFQTQVNLAQAPAVEGALASLNPRYVLPGTGGNGAASSTAIGVAWAAGSGGVTLGRFAWGDLTATDSILTNAGSGAPTCLVAREMGDASITTYLTEYGMVIPQGFAVPYPLTGGDVWVKNTAAGANTIGQKAFASNTTGQVQFANAGGTISGYTETKWYAATVGAANELVKITSSALD